MFFPYPQTPDFHRVIDFLFGHRKPTKVNGCFEAMRGRKRGNAIFDQYSTFQVQFRLILKKMQVTDVEY